MRTAFERLAVCLVLSVSSTSVLGQIQPGTAQARTDWEQRSQGAAVFYANNFSGYTDSADLRNRANTLSHNAGQNEILLDPSLAISGGKSLHIKTYSTAGKNGGAWGDQYANGVGVNDFYFQIALYLPKETIGWRTEIADGQLKLVNLERYGGGQVVISSHKFLGFPTVMTNGGGLISRYLDGLPYRKNDWFYQNAIDSGSSLTAGTQEAYWRRYGPARSTFLAADNAYISDDADANFLYNRTTPWPDPDAIESGAVPWNLDGWTVVEVYISTTEGGSQELKMWAAPYGAPPTLVVDLHAPNSDLSTAPRYRTYERFELLNYETPREPEINYRPVLHTYYDELIVSHEPIPFPGGFNLGAGNGGSSAVRPMPPEDVTAQQ